MEVVVHKLMFKSFNDKMSCLSEATRQLANSDQSQVNVEEIQREPEVLCGGFSGAVKDSPCQIAAYQYSTRIPERKREMDETHGGRKT